ncbi:competence type IV pilus assembly protein ComGB [Lysinibacillus piscis]|uniref:Secretion system protein F n=1 Tax=Lysinibacillus piscis TaxID=2518931 RepID=A0ABQ5NJW2_9BACI|nr:competence type IV pilus assembly protein ComGB [Lysinibacillus sp. KH24]GLC88648.1 secretion system protein F [Lysinibacillus sp. KH24]
MWLRQWTDNIKQTFRRNTKWRVREQADFFHRLSILMQEGYLFPQAIAILLPHHVKAYDEMQFFIDEKLRQGGGVTSVLMQLQLAKPYLVAITVAESNGHMIEAFHGIAKQMALQKAIKDKLSKLLIYPIVLTVFLVFLFFVFRTLFFPNIEQMVVNRVTNQEYSSITLAKFLLHMPDAFIMSGGAVVGSGLLFMLYIKRYKVAKQLHIVAKIPIVKRYIRLSVTRQFAVYLGSLLQSGFSLQASLRVLEEQPHQPSLQYLAQAIKERVMFGDTLTQAVQFMEIWQKDFAVFIHHGEQSGYLGKELMVYSELLTEKQQQWLQRVLAFVQPTFFILIAICIVAAYISILLPIYQMIEFV